MEGLVDALEVSKNNLKRDELNYWNIFGRRGKIYTDSEYWYLYKVCETPRRWNSVKSSLNFMGIWQDGDDEGVLRLQRYPTEEESEKIRKIIGFNKSKKLTETEKEKLLERLGNGHSTKD